MSKIRPVKRRKEGKRGQTLLLAGKYYREGEKEGGGEVVFIVFQWDVMINCIAINSPIKS